MIFYFVYFGSDPSTGSIPNPYVTLTLDSQRARTEVNMQARSPNFGETLSLSVGEQANTLAVNVFSHNLIFADDYLGGSTVLFLLLLRRNFNSMLIHCSDVRFLWRLSVTLPPISFFVWRILRMHPRHRVSSF
jgi:hypothetical protein